MSTTPLETTLLFLQVAEAFDEEKECEHNYHADPRQARFHAGKAEWYVQAQCPDCGSRSGVMAVCDRWLKSSEGAPVVCPDCWESAPVVFLVKERIK